VIATIIPIRVNTMIAICVQIQVGDIVEDSLAREPWRVPSLVAWRTTIVWIWIDACASGP
jgi:hypothetical protein